MSQPTTNLSILYLVPGLGELLETIKVTPEELLKSYDVSYKAPIVNVGPDLTKEWHFELDTEPLHVTSVFEFFYWFFIMMLIVTAILKWKVLDVSVAEANLEHPEVLLLDEEEEIIKNREQQQQNKQQQQPKNNTLDKDTQKKKEIGDPTKNQEDEEKEEDEEEEDEEEDDETKKKNEDNEDGEENKEDDGNDNSENVIKKKSKTKKADNSEEQNVDDINIQMDDPSKEGQKDVEKGPKQNTQKPTGTNAAAAAGADASGDDKKIKIARILVRVVEDFVERYLVIGVIMIYLSMSFGSYAYTACVCFFGYLAAVPLNSLEIFKEKSKGLQHLFFHFWFLTLFIAYFIINQKYNTVGSVEDKKAFWVVQ